MCRIAPNQLHLNLRVGICPDVNERLPVNSVKPLKLLGPVRINTSSLAILVRCPFYSSDW
jgi:hypothetical protein